MSLPREIIDRLLSGYLDDALSDDECTRVEQLLREDADIAREFDELKELRETLRDIYHVDQRRQLRPGFADRVLKATVDQGATEGLAEEHPVMMLAQQPSRSVTPKGLPLGKIAGVLVALAASTIVAIAVYNTPEQVIEQGGVAKVDPPSVSVDPLVTPPEPNPLQHESPQNEPIEQVVTNDRMNDSTEERRENPSLDEPPTQGVNSPAVDQIAGNTIPPAEPSVAELERLLLLGSVMVLDVRQTEEGRQSHAVSTALKDAGLKTANQKQINKQIVGFASDLSKADDSVLVLYLEGPAKKLDNFINRMVLDLDGIEAVGFKMVNEAPIVGVADALQELDPTTVKHEASWQLTDDQGDSVQVLAQQLASRDFKQFRRTGERELPPLDTSDDGPDVNSRVFVLVR